MCLRNQTVRSSTTHHFVVGAMSHRGRSCDSALDQPLRSVAMHPLSLMPTWVPPSPLGGPRHFQCRKPVAVTRRANLIASLVDSREDRERSHCSQPVTGSHSPTPVRGELDSGLNLCVVEREERKTIVTGEGKKREISGPPSFGAPPFGASPFGAPLLFAHHGRREGGWVVGGGGNFGLSRANLYDFFLA